MYKTASIFDGWIENREEIFYIFIFIIPGHILFINSKYLQIHIWHILKKEKYNCKIVQSWQYNKVLLICCQPSE